MELAGYFVDARGRKAEERVFSVKNGTFPADPPKANQLLYNDTYAQDDAPARDLPAAAGHAVRAMYFYSAMADIAREYGDERLYEACRRLWNDSVMHKMYITGGVSAERYGRRSARIMCFLTIMLMRRRVLRWLWRIFQKGCFG